MDDILNVDDLFKDESELEQPNEQASEPAKEPELDMTKAMSERINTVKRKTESETQERIAKELGYESYAQMIKAKESQAIKDAGYDDEDINKLVEDLLEKRLQSDPRLKKLEEYEARDKQDFVAKELAEINKLSDVKYTSIDELPAETLNLWEKTGNLKQAYLATEGEKLLTSKSHKVDNGSTNHLANPGASSLTKHQRALNEDEKAIYRAVLGDMITEEELSKMTTDIK
jgi:predicted transcriptional regulator